MLTVLKGNSTRKLPINASAKRKQKPSCKPNELASVPRECPNVDLQCERPNPLRRPIVQPAVHLDSPSPATSPVGGNVKPRRQPKRHQAALLLPPLHPMVRARKGNPAATLPQDVVQKVELRRCLQLAAVSMPERPAKPVETRAPEVPTQCLAGDPVCVVLQHHRPWASDRPAPRLARVPPPKSVDLLLASMCRCIYATSSERLFLPPTIQVCPDNIPAFLLTA